MGASLFDFSGGGGMLKRFYIDNYKTLVNFELNLDPINLFLGPNGSGKTAVFDALHKITHFINFGDKASIFSFSDLTRWGRKGLQQFELDMEHEQNLYQYKLTINIEAGKLNAVKYEGLFFNGKPLLTFENTTVHLYDDQNKQVAEYPFEQTRSALATIPSEPAQSKLSWFREKIKRFLIVQIDPAQMLSTSGLQPEEPYRNLRNFASWYHYLFEEKKLLDEEKLVVDLKEVLPGFKGFSWREMLEGTENLDARFEHFEWMPPIRYDFRELSDGQRTLIALYTLLHVAQSDDQYGYTLCIDEPDNFIALPEIQPWLLKLYDLCIEEKAQVLLISHHPELINYLLSPPSVGIWFERESNGPTHIKRVQDDDEGGLSPAKLVAVGWINDY